jgi:hypothetical protein
MKKVFFLFGLSAMLLIACQGEFTPKKESLLGKWQETSGQHYFEFIDQQRAFLIYPKGEQTDTMRFSYQLRPDSTPIQFDMQFEGGELKGLHTFGILEFRTRDTFVVTSKRGFEGSDDKYRPSKIEPMQQSIYVRQQ